jgi:hypothetical protein
MGIYSKPFTERMEPAVTKFVEQMTSVRQAMNESDRDMNAAQRVLSPVTPPPGAAGAPPAPPAGGRSEVATPDSSPTTESK